MKKRAAVCCPINLICCIGVESEFAYLRHFLEHYFGIGISPENFHLILNTKDENSPKLQQAVGLLRTYGIVNPEVWIGPYTSDAMWAKRRDIQARRVSHQSWVVSADVDEFHEYPEQLSAFLAECESKKVNCVQGVFIDRLSADGSLASLAPSDDIWERFPLQADVQCTIGGRGKHHNWYGTIKLMAFSGDLFPARGGHFPTEGGASVRYLLGRNIGGFPWIGQSWFRFRVPFRVHHFKWTASMPGALKRRHATRGVSPAGAEYGEKLLAYVERNNGINVADVPVRRNSLADKLDWRFWAASLRACDKAFRIGGKTYRLARRARARLARMPKNSE